MSSADEFSKHLARVRDRFAAGLESKISESFAALETAADDTALPTTVTAHRRLHEMCGIAPTLGFPATGNAARAAEAVMRNAVKAKRPLKTDEIVALQVELQTLRSAAQAELEAHAAAGTPS